MQPIVYLTPRFAVTGALVASDLPEVRRLGFAAVISNRPDNEDTGQMNGKAEATAAWRAGLKFRHVPASKLEMFTDEVVEGMADALAGLDGPVLAHCKSGLRSAIAWAAAGARSQSVDCVLETLRDAGFDLEFLRDDLDAQADRRRWLGTTTALDCDCDVRELRRTAA